MAAAAAASSAGSSGSSVYDVSEAEKRRMAQDWHDYWLMEEHVFLERFYILFIHSRHYSMY